MNTSAVLAQSVALLVLSVIAGVAFGESVTVSIEAPLQNVDGSALVDLQNLRLEVGTCVGTGSFGSHITQYDFPTGVSTLTLTGWNPATYCLRGFAINTSGVISPPSDVLAYTLVGSAPPPPPPPQLVTVSTVAYTITNANDRLAFLIVGSVPLGTPCDRTQQANGFNVVPRSAVTFDGATKPTAVLARCQ